MKAFAGESQARNRYDYYASVAGREGYKQIEHVFRETADQEKEHAKRLFRLMGGFAAECEITASFPVGPEKDTIGNLKDSAAGENHEHSSMYPEFAKTADEEGFPEIAKVFRSIAVAEHFHEQRFLGLAKNIADNKVFSKDSKTGWRCRNCGYVMENSANAPAKCPACDHPQAHFETLSINW